MNFHMFFPFYGVRNPRPLLNVFSYNPKFFGAQKNKKICDNKTNFYYKLFFKKIQKTYKKYFFQKNFFKTCSHIIKYFCILITHVAMFYLLYSIFIYIWRLK